MAEETIVAVFDTEREAEAVVRELEAAGVPSTSITRHARDTMLTGSTGAAVPRERGFWSSLFGTDPEADATSNVYDRSIESGGSVVSVRADQAHAARVTEIIERHNPVDIEERAATYGLRTGAVSGTAAGPVTAERAAGETDRLALAEEQLVVGKRAVNRGTTRIHRFVVETPVEESVSLRDEQVTIERRPVEAGRAVTDADFGDRMIEVTETGEEAVVSKTARIREEVLINKTATERTETIHDSVRREDVRIEKDAATGRPGVSGTSTDAGASANSGSNKATDPDVRKPIDTVGAARRGV